MMKKNEKELKNLYVLVDAETEDFANILLLLNECHVETIEELIKKHPGEAYVNGIIYDYDFHKTYTAEECKERAVNYFKNEIAGIEEILEDVKALNGNYEKCRLQLAAITEYCKKHIQGLQQ